VVVCRININSKTFPDTSLGEYNAELEALHMFIVMMMFMSLALSSLLSLIVTT